MEVVIYYLEMCSKTDLRAKPPVVGLEIIKCEISQWRFNRFLYNLVGAAWQWTDKLSWSDEQWNKYAHDLKLHTWVAYFRGSPAGYYELKSRNDGEVEIAYFGLAPDFIGRGFGGYLLSHAISTAWNIPLTRRVWVHTCSLDHPSALRNYQARGMKLYKEEVQMR